MIEQEAVIRYLPLARTLAARLHAKLCAAYGFSVDELLSFALEGVLGALRTYDESRNVPLNSWVIRKADHKMLDGIRAHGPFRRRGGAQRHEILLLGGAQCHDSYLCRASQRRAAQAEARETIEWAIRSLNERDRRIIRLRWLDGKTFKEIASEVGLSESAAFYRHSLALKFVRERSSE